MDGWKAVLLVTGAILVGLAGLLALSDVTADGTECGTILSPKEQTALYPTNFESQLSASMRQMDCDDAITERRGQAIGATVVGAVLLVLGLMRKPDNDRSQDAPQPDWVGDAWA